MSTISRKVSLFFFSREKFLSSIYFMFFFFMFSTRFLLFVFHISHEEDDGPCVSVEY